MNNRNLKRIIALFLVSAMSLITLASTINPTAVSASEADVVFPFSESSETSPYALQPTADNSDIIDMHSTLMQGLSFSKNC